jgi:tetratricopeptide (TPR) repeat protein
MKAMQKFFDRYVSPLLQSGAHISVLDVGGMDVNGSYRAMFSHPCVRYVATDMESGPGVDHVQVHPYKLPFPDGSFDVVLSGQTFEHCPRFWDLAVEMRRVLKQEGVMALICPSSGPIHRYPVDCYRFLPDSMAAVAEHAGLALLETEYVDTPPWNDVVGIMKKSVMPGNGSRAAVQPPDYIRLLEFFHHLLVPRTYFEIGTNMGASLTLASCASIAVDPVASSQFDVLGRKSSLKYFAKTSDDFFATVDLGTELSGVPVDLAFIDGFHSFDQVLRDFIHLEPYCAPETVICIHDVLPRTDSEAARDRRTSSWAGDVWKVVDILRQYRPLLRYACLDVAPTGIFLVTGFSSQAQKFDLDATVAQHINRKFPSVEELKMNLQALSPEEFFASEAKEFFGKALRNENNAMLLQQASLDFHRALESSQREKWNVDELNRLISQVNCYPLYPSTWRSLLKHLRENDRLSLYLTVAKENEPVFDDPVVGSELLLLLANVCQELGDVTSAIQAMEKAILSGADQAEHHMRLSRLYVRHKDQEKAVASARAAISLKDDLPGHHQHLGTLLFQVGDLDGAARSLERALELGGDAPDCHMLLSRIHTRKNDLEKAVASARAAISLKDDVPGHHQHLGTLLLRTGDLDGAARSLERALELGGDAPDCHMKLSHVHARRHDLEKAVASARTAISLKGDVPGYHRHLGNLFLRMGDLAGALESLERALELDPADERSRAILRQISPR